MTDWLRYCNFLFLSTSNTMYYKDLNQAQQERLGESFHDPGHAAKKNVGVLQISLCLIFIVIYFSVLSLQQIVELKRESKGIKVLSYIGKSNKQIKELVKKQIAGKLLMPMFMTLLVLLFSIPLVNLKLNLLLPIVMHNILLRAVFCFAICFLLFYVCYFFVVYTISKQYVGIVN